MKFLNNSVKGAIVLSFIASSSLYATNGDTLIGVGAKTRAMGGAGIALSQGAESTLVNPALITTVKDTEISFGGTVFMPTIKTQMSPVEHKSDADLSIIPGVAIASNVAPNTYVGVGMWGTAGMGTDFKKYPDLFKMETTLQLMQFAVPVAYKFANGLSVGVAPIMQYGSLDIHFQMPPQMGGMNVGDGQNQDFGFGASAGLTYDFGNGFTVGAVYKSKISMNYAHSLTAATAPFGLNFGDKLAQPAEYGVGVSYKNGPHTIAVDYKKIKWGSAAGYKDFGWKDQNVFAIGYEYDAGKWAARIGFNHATNPLTIYNTPMKTAVDMFNLLGFPATAENHITLGGSYKFNQNFSVDTTVVYGLNKKSSADVSAMFGPGAKISNKHAELGLTVQLNYKF
jgi:long-chain fatty acid transport protein